LTQWKWCAVKAKYGYYAYRGVYLGGGKKNRKYKAIAMHRLIMNTPDGMECDHRDFNGL